jgi:hypothetical protein
MKSGVWRRAVEMLLYGIMLWFPEEPCKISGQQTLVTWYGKISK